jgi:hypothetical protein
MTPRKSLWKFHGFISDAPRSARSDLMVRIMSDAVWAIHDRDNGRASSRPRAVMPSDASEVPEAAGMLFIFLRALAAPNGLTALARAMQRGPTSDQTPAAQRKRVLRSRMYLAQLDLLALERAVPPVPADVLELFR